jgi:hypothetical protein
MKSGNQIAFFEHKRDKIQQLQNKLLNCSDEEMITMNITVFFMPSHAV